MITNKVTNKDARKLRNHATEVASMMEDDEIDQVIVDFVEVKNMRKRGRCKTKW